MPKFSFGQQKQHSESELNPWLKSAQPWVNSELLPYTQQMLRSYDPTGGAVGKGTRGYITESLGGKYAPSAELEAALGASQKNFDRYANANLNSANQAAARSGMLASGAANRMREGAARRNADQWAERETGARLQDYYNWQNRRADAARLGMSQGQQDLSQLMQFINLFGRGGTSKTSGVGRQYGVQL